MRGAVIHGAGDVRVDERDKPTLRGSLDAPLDAPAGVRTLPATVRAALGPAAVSPGRTVLTSIVRGTVRS
ncbi:hypothetical protein ACTMTI_18330 [Nonomuraea sp. H19]|uniref:hypothetical protein n=1 Tax=Nonomuraea sp. H19 TaxID=3452206 RepID=UPI003F8A3AD6